MAWTTPLTAVANATLTAAQWNASVRDDLLETAPAKATTAGRIFVATGANTIAERAISANAIATQQSTTSTSYTNLATTGPAVTVTTGANAIAFISGLLSNNTSTAFALASIAVSGATTVAASDSNSLNWQPSSATSSGVRATAVAYYTSLTPGSNTFTMQYRASAGTATFQDRVLTVMGL